MTLLLPSASVTALVALLAVLGVRTVLAERAAATSGTGFPRPAAVWWLDLVAIVLSVLCVAALVTTVVTGLNALY